MFLHFGLEQQNEKNSKCAFQTCAGPISKWNHKNLWEILSIASSDGPKIT